MKKILLLLLFTFPFAVFSQELSADLSQLAAAFKQVQTIQTEFVQETHSDLFTAPVTSEGFLHFQKQPSYLKWEYTKPFASGLLVENGKIFRMRNGQFVPVKNGAAGQIAAQVTVWLQLDLETLVKQYTIVSSEGKLEFSPRTSSAPVGAITLTYEFVQQHPVVTRLEMREKSGDKTVLRFKNTRVNESFAREEV